MNTNNTTTLDEPTENTRKTLGAILLVACVSFLAFYIYLLSVIIKQKMWQKHSFHLWFLSIGGSDLINLCMYIYGSFLIVFQKQWPDTSAAVWSGHFYNFAYVLCCVQFLVTAVIRTLVIVFPTRSPDWFTVKKTLIQIATLWVCIVINTVVLQSYDGNNFFFSPTRMSWDSDYWDLYIADGFDIYWSVVPITSVLLSSALYLICFLKLRCYKKVKVAGNIGSSTTTLKAEKSLIKIGLALSLVITVDAVFWLLNGTLLGDISWIIPLSLSYIEVGMYGMNSILICTLCSDIYSHTVFQHIFKRNSPATALFSVNSRSIRLRMSDKI